MNIAVFTDDGKRELLDRAIRGLQIPGRQPRCILFDDYDEFIGGLSSSGCQMMVVARPGAEGMESVRAARILLPEVPLLWFSDDKGFGPESFRAGCSYFTAEPLTEDLVRHAFFRFGM